MPRITPNLWFDTESEEAAEFYVSVFPNSKITNVLYYGEAGPRPAGTVLTVDFVLDGQEYTAINGGPRGRVRTGIGGGIGGGAWDDAAGAGRAGMAVDRHACPPGSRPDRRSHRANGREISL